MSNTVAEMFEDLKGQAGSAGVCEVADLMGRMNIVGPEILDRIHAKGTVSTWCLVVCNNCIVLPSDLATPLQAWLCGSSLGLRGEFWLGRLGGDIAYDLGQEVPWGEVVDDGRYAHTQVYPVPSTINDVYEITARSEQDKGKVVEIRYASAAGREIIFKPTLVGSHVASEASATGIGDVIRVSKPRTVGAIELWLRNLHTGNRLLVAVYDGHDEIPTFRVVHLTGCAKGKLVIKGKRRWQNLRSDQDIVPFGRVAVWRAALAAEAALANKNFAQFNELVGVAVGLLDAELTGLRAPGTGETVSFITPFTMQNRRPIRRRFS